MDKRKLLFESNLKNTCQDLMVGIRETKAKVNEIRTRCDSIKRGTSKQPFELNKSFEQPCKPSASFHMQQENDNMFFKKKIEDLQFRLDSQEAKLRAREKEICYQQSQIKQYVLEINQIQIIEDNYKEEIANLNKELSQWKEKYFSNLKEFQFRQAQLSRQAQQEQSAMRKKYEEIIEQQQKEIDAIEIRYENERDNMYRALDHQRMQQTKNSDFDELINKFEEVEQENLELKEKLLVLEANKDELKFHTSQLSGRLAEQVNKYLVLEQQKHQEIQQCQNQLQAKDKQINSLLVQIENEKDNEQLQDQDKIISLENLNNQLIEQNLQLEDEVNKLNQKIQEDSKTEMLEKENNNLQMILNDYKQKNLELRQLYSQQQEQLTENQKNQSPDIDQLQQEIKYKDHLLTELQNANEKIQAKLISGEGEQGFEYDQQELALVINELKTQNEELESKQVEDQVQIEHMISKLNQYQKEQNKLLQQISEYSEKFQDLQKQLEEKDEEIQVQGLLLEKQNKGSKEFDRLLNQQRSENKELQSQNQLLINQKEILQLQAEEISSANQKLQTQLVDAQRLQQEMQEQASTLEKQVESTKVEISNQQNLLLMKEQERFSNITQLENENVALYQMKNELQKKLSSLEQDFDLSQRQHEEDLCLWEKEKQSLKAQLASKEQQLCKIQGDIEFVQENNGESQQLKLQINELLVQNNFLKVDISSKEENLKQYQHEAIKHQELGLELKNIIEQQDIQINQLKKSIFEITQINQRLQEEQNDNKQIISESEVRNKREIENLIEENSQYQALIAQLEEEKGQFDAQLSKQIDDDAEELDKLQLQISQQDIQIQQQLHEIESHKQEKNILQQQLEELKILKDECPNQNDQGVSKDQEIQNQMDINQTIAEEYEEQKQQIEELYNSQKEMVIQLSQQQKIIQQLESTILIKDQTIQQKEDNLVEVQAQLDMQRKLGGGNDPEELQYEIEQLKDTVEEQAEKLQQKDQIIEQWRDNRKNKEREQQNSNLEIELERIKHEKEIQALKQRIVETIQEKIVLQIELSKQQQNSNQQFEDLLDMDDNKQNFDPPNEEDSCNFALGHAPESEKSDNEVQEDIQEELEQPEEQILIDNLIEMKKQNDDNQELKEPFINIIQNVEQDLIELDQVQEIPEQLLEPKVTIIQNEDNHNLELDTQGNQLEELQEPLVEIIQNIESEKIELDANYEIAEIIQEPQIQIVQIDKQFNFELDQQGGAIDLQEPVVEVIQDTSQQKIELDAQQQEIEEIMEPKVEIILNNQYLQIELDQQDNQIEFQEPLVEIVQNKSQAEFELHQNLQVEEQEQGNISINPCLEDTSFNPDEQKQLSNKLIESVVDQAIQNILNKSQ